MLQEKHHVAIEQKYRGVSHADIGTQLSIPKGTVDDWFRSRGILSPYYKEFADEMAKKREQRMYENLEIKDQEMLLIVRRLITLFGKRLMNGEYKPTGMDFLRAWKIQRIMQNKPTAVYSHKCPVCKEESLRYRYR